MRPRKEIEADVEKAIEEGEKGDLKPLQRILIETFLDIRELLMEHSQDGSLPRK